MSASFTLTLCNPAVTGSIKNVAYTGLPRGNTLDLLIGNNFGFELTIGGSSTGKYLVVEISDSIIDQEGAAKLSAAAPWKIDSYTAPARKGDAYAFNLLPPPAGVSLPNGGSIQVELLDLLPAAKGNAQLLATYQFDHAGTALQVAAPLIVMAQSNPALPSLVGPNAPLRFNFLVNGGGESTPVVVSAAPVTADNAVENTLQMIFNFQETTSMLKASGAWLVDQWDPAHPPQFRFFFPYFSPFSNSPALFDLTDSYQAGDADYNPITSAWNIQESLDAGNPNIHSNSFWQIQLDSHSQLPVWEIAPNAANTHLFSVEGSVPGGPGPLLNLFWSHIFSGLPIDQNNPETMLFVQWINFPGFNDGIQGFPLLKEYPKPVIKPIINAFSGEIRRDSNGTKILLRWDTSNAAHCTISGDSSLQAPSTGNNPYQRLISIEQPLSGHYTLTAVSLDGLYSATQSLQVKWKINPDLAPTNWSNGIRLRMFGDGSAIVVLQSTLSMDPGMPSTLSFVDPLNLNERGQSFLFPPHVYIDNMAVSAYDNSTVFAIGGAYGQMFVYAYSKSSGQTIQSDALSFPPWYTEIKVSNDGSFLYALLIGSGGHKMHLLNTATLKNMSGSPIALSQDPVTAFGIGPQSGRYFINYIMKMHVLDPVTFQEVPGSPFSSFCNLIVFPADEHAVYTTAPPYLALRNAQTFAMGKKGDFSMNGLGAGLFYPHFITPDNSLLFIAGLDPNTNDQIIKVFNAATMELLDWSPWAGQTKQILDMLIAPDGTRMYALTSDGDLCALDPYF